MAHFYNKQIEIYNYKSTKDSNGINRKSWVKVIDGLPDPLLVDVQPFSMEKASRVYGYSVECTKRIFIDKYDVITEDNESSAIKYNNKFYKVQKIIEWDTYNILLILERNDIKIG